MPKPNKILLVVVGLLVAGFNTALAAPQWTYQRTLLPIDTTEDVGTTTNPWDRGFFNDLYLTNLGGSGTRCVQVGTDGKLAKASAACGSGSGGGSGTGTWATTTSNVPGNLINYPLNTTDVVVIGDSATTSAPWWYNPNVFVGYLKGLFGIGTTSPSAPLAVNGGAYIGGSLITTNLNATGTATIGNLSGAVSASSGVLSAGTLSIANGGTNNNAAIGASSTVAHSDGTKYVFYKLSPADSATANVSQWTNDSGYLTAVTADSPLSGSGTSGSHLTISTAGTWSGNAGTATALAANGTNCSGGSYPLGVDASGNSENCTVATTGTVTAVTGTWPVISSGGTTPNLTWGGLATSSAISSGQLLYGTGVNTLTSVATGTVTCTGTVSCGAGSYVVGSNLTITGSGGSGSGTVSTSSVPSVGNLAYWTSNGYPSLLGTVATGTLSATGNIAVTAGNSVIGSGATISFTGTLPIASGGTNNNAAIGASSTAVLSDGTKYVYYKLSPANFTTSNVSQWTNDSGYLTVGTLPFTYPFPQANNGTSTVVTFNGGFNNNASSSFSGQTNFNNQINVKNDTSLLFAGGASGCTNSTGIKTGSDGTFLFDAGCSIKFKGGTGLTQGFTDGSFNYVWQNDLNGNTTQSGRMTSLFASTTAFSTSYASSSQYWGANLPTGCDPTSGKLLWSGGTFSCGLDAGAGASGEANTASTLGTGRNLYDSKSGVDLRFNSISAGTNVTISTSSNANTLVINATDSTASSTLLADNNTFTGANNFSSNTAQIIKYASTTALSSNSIDVNGFVNVSQYAGYRQDGLTILNASTTNGGTFVGSSAGAAVTAAGTGNTAIGRQALPTNSVGTDNTIIGRSAATSLTGSANTVIGKSALNTVSNYDATIAIGKGAGSGTVSGGGNIVIGTGVNLPSTSATNQLNIGNLLYGTGIYADGSTNSSVPAGGKLGVGTTTPASILSVQGDTLVSGTLTAANLTATGTLTLSGITGTQCLHATNGVVSGSGSDCGSGGGGGGTGGTWSTTTSQTPGVLNNYPNNATDVAVVGSNSTTTAEYWLDPNTRNAHLGATNLIVGSSTSSGYSCTGTGSPCWEFRGDDNSDNGVNLHIRNKNPGDHAAVNLILSNDITGNPLDYYGVLGLNSSTYSNTDFGNIFAVPNQVYLQSSNGPLTLVSSGGGGNGYINFAVNGSSVSDEAMRINVTHDVLMGTTTDDNTVFPGQDSRLQVWGDTENIISAYSNINDFTEINCLNFNAGNNAQCGFSATRNDGNLTGNFIWMGANSTGFWNPTAFNAGGAGDGVILSDLNDFFIVQGTTGRKTHFLNGGVSTSSNEVMTFATTSTNLNVVGIGTTTPSQTLSVQGNSLISGNLSAANITATGTLTLGNALTVANGGTGVKTLTGCLTGNGTGAITGSGTCNTSNASVSSVGLTSTGSTLTITNSPITTSGNLNGELNLAHSNAWTALQTFTNATTTQLGLSGPLYDAASAGTGGFVLMSQGTSTAPKWVATTTFSTGVTYAGGAVTCDTASVSVFGCLSAVSFSKFNSATTTFSSPLVYTLGTNAVTCPTCVTSLAGAASSTLLADNNTFTGRNKINFASTTAFTIPTLYDSNGGVGASSTVLTSNGSLDFWTKLATSQLTNDSGFLTSANAVTSVATNNGLTGGTITTTGTIGLNVTKLVSGTLVGWDGTQLTATGTSNLTAGYITSTSTTGSYFAGGVSIASSSPPSGSLLTIQGTTTAMSVVVDDGRSNATTTIELGNVGRKAPGCINWVYATGAGTYATSSVYINTTGALTVEASSCK